jgi:hypothetical protein
MWSTKMGQIIMGDYVGRNTYSIAYLNMNDDGL